MNRAPSDINALSVVTGSRMARVYRACSFDDSVARRRRTLVASARYLCARFSQRVEGYAKQKKKEREKTPANRRPPPEISQAPRYITVHLLLCTPSLSFSLCLPLTLFIFFIQIVSLHSFPVEFGIWASTAGAVVKFRAP